MPLTSREFLQLLSSGAELTPAALDEVLHAKEDLLLDFKSAKELGDKKKAAQTLRSYIAAFAGGLGGAIVFGVSDLPRRIEACPNKIGDASLHDWASRVLSAIAPHIHSPIRIDEVLHRDGRVLVVSTARCDSLVPVVDAGEIAYYVRIGESTLRAPDYLIGDILSGRRARANLVASATVDPELAPGTGGHNTLHLNVSVANESLVSAEDISFAAVYWGPAHSNGVVAPEFLHTWLQLDRAGLPPGTALFQYAVPTGFKILQACQATQPTKYAITVHAAQGPVEIACACYLTARDCPPTWHQLRVALRPQQRMTAVELLEFAPSRDRVQIYRRPVAGSG